ncbi:MAG TPA: aspartate-semialdehyde dehydrogenase [Candidatus Thermoplasmatota archaeon]|nr:aspartate-semialdehyde dehydrogenase [Candidatus Thermoplasmatota archaeon]
MVGQTKRKVAILGATGMVGQRFLSLLQNHPWFEVTALVASERSAGKTYGEAARWVLNEPMPDKYRDMPVVLSDAALDADLCFSAIPGDLAGPVESELAKKGYKIFSNAKAHRWDRDVPLLVPEVNPDHAHLVKRQNHGSGGYIVTNGNCSTIVMVMTLKPLVDAFGVKRVFVSTYQAVSGAGYPGVPSIDILGNVIPYIGSEEEKIEREPLKMLGTLGPDGVAPADLRVSATAVRVPVEEGHSMAVSVELGRAATPEEVARTMREWRSRPQHLKLPSAPERPLEVLSETNRPQPRKDWRRGNGMSVNVGRIRPDPLFTVKYFASGSNTVRGAAGSNILGAELLLAEGLL